MKRTHFPTKHPGLPYRQKGEQALSFNVFQPPCPEPSEAATKDNPAELPDAVMEVDKADHVKETVTNKELMENLFGDQPSYTGSDKYILNYMLRQCKKLFSSYHWAVIILEGHIYL